MYVGTTVQARLDEETHAALLRLARQRGWSASKVVRESIRLMDTQQRPKDRPKLIGVGMFASGVTDLATNPKYMEDFGLDREQRRTRKKI